ncbi:MAG TPA: right-handed parallel beta-helix repeat-containing protein, partial [Fimbriimonadaceae bacterium]|nr:right-handed parallel beta-helix repeat-containing protein [Fimbriimonadaceae bacterium]
MISALCTLALLPPQTPIALTSKMTISRSATVVPKVYAFASAASDGKDAAIRIVGNNLVVDFKGATLQGTAPTVEPDQRKGTGVYVQGRNITIKNLKIRGYKVGLAAWNSPNIKLENIDASYNWKQRLLSTLDREDGADWMSFHRNENDQWLRFGAAIYLRGCNDFEVKGSRAIGGQCGLMITECNRGRIWNNNFSFLSAIGIGMYKSSENRIMHNNVDWCLRGYSHGKWNRGQDSAGILIYEQSHKNVFAYNSVTHGGDGFFLWAGQTTMDTGQGGCNDNLLYGNDWSHAPTNGIEATFSRNNFVNNLILECWHGIWGGYSYESKVIGNVFGLNAESIAWEHGQDNLVKGNVFHRETMAVNLWANASQDPNWGYPKNRDTRSRDWKIEGNLFSHIVGNTLRVRRTNGLTFTDNRVHNSSVPAIVSSDAASITAPSENEFAVPPGNIFTQNGQAAELGANNRVNQADGRSPMAATMQPSGNVILGLDLQTRAYLERFNLSWNPWLNGGPAPAGAREASVGDELSRPFAP